MKNTLLITLLLLVSTFAYSTINERGLADNTMSATNISLYHNSVKNEVIVEYRFKGKPTPITRNVYDMMGNKVYEETIPCGEGTNYNIIDTKVFVNGLYSLEMIINNQIYRQTFVISR